MDQSEAKKRQLAERMMMAMSGQQYLPNKFIDTKQRAEGWAEDIPLGLAEVLAGIGVSTLPARGATILPAAGLMMDGTRRVMMGTEGDRIAKRLKYQGN